MVRWHYWLNGREFEQTPGDSEGQASCCAAIHGVAKSQTQLSDWTTTVSVSEQIRSAVWERTPRMGPGEPLIKRFIPPSPWKPGALLQDDGRLTLFSLQTDSEVIKGAASITGLPLGWERVAGAAGTYRSSGGPTSTTWHHVSATCTRAWCSSAAPGAGRCSWGTGSRLWQHPCCAHGVHPHWAHGCLHLGFEGQDQPPVEPRGWDCHSFLPSRLSSLNWECVSCAPPTILYFGSTWQVWLHRHTAGECASGWILPWVSLISDLHDNLEETLDLWVDIWVGHEFWRVHVDCYRLYYSCNKDF